MIDHAFTPRPIADARIISAFPRCAFPNCGGAQHEHVELDTAFLAAFYPETFKAEEPVWVPVCGKDGKPMSRAKGCLSCACYERR